VTLTLSAQFATSMQSPWHIAIAEKLGYTRAWLFDTPHQSPDVWMMLALAAAHTTQIGLGPGVLVPTLRHPMVNASATAALAALAPGRVAVAFGTGFAGARALGMAPTTWAYLRTGLCPDVPGAADRKAGHLERVDAADDACARAAWSGHPGTDFGVGPQGVGRRGRARRRAVLRQRRDRKGTPQLAVTTPARKPLMHSSDWSDGASVTATGLARGGPNKSPCQRHRPQHKCPAHDPWTQPQPWGRVVLGVRGGRRAATLSPVLSRQLKLFSFNSRSWCGSDRPGRPRPARRHR
jgi:hypothetical protein